jgi:LysM repeat protein
MNSSNSQTPESSLQDQKTAGRARVKVAVFSVLALHVAGLMALLMTQGCKREVPPEPEPTVPVMDTNLPPDLGTNLPPDLASNLPPVDGGLTGPGAQPPVDMGAAIVSEYIVQKGDSFYSIAKNHGTTIKAIEAANPGVDSRKLKVGQKLNLPAPGAAPAPSLNGAAPMADVAGETTYIVKSGDTLTRIASRNGTTVKAIKSLNNLSTDRITVGQKLKLPVKPVPAPAPLPEPPPMTAPATTPAPAPAQ